MEGLINAELRLISLRVPFVKMVALPSGKLSSIHGPAVNVPSKLGHFTNPPNKSQSSASERSTQLKIYIHISI